MFLVYLHRIGDLAVGTILKKKCFDSEIGKFLIHTKHSRQPISWAALLCVCISFAELQSRMVGSPFLMPSSLMYLSQDITKLILSIRPGTTDREVSSTRYNLSELNL